MISEPLPNFQTHFSQKEEVGSYDNIALSQRCCATARWSATTSINETLLT